MMKSRRTKALEISMKTKQKVWERQDGVSLWSGKPITVSECCCHVVPRSKGGLGIEQNIVGLTQEEHMIFDDNLPRTKGRTQMIQMRAKALKHLKQHYTDWNMEDCIYKK